MTTWQMEGTGTSWHCWDEEALRLEARHLEEEKPFKYRTITGLQQPPDPSHNTSHSTVEVETPINRP
ncbi:GL10206 [Drosophila persimilis]|uniref:GL10206 n=1 Tax=Drosophila persimilis TaxID=7234 RepID=B4H531_DROPE|nr:GL10206 [Drosophila persimilis]